MKKQVVVLFLLITAGVYAQKNSASYPDNMVRINGGTFMMGSLGDEEQYQVKKEYQVTLSPFYMGRTEVTQKEYREVMGTNPSAYKGDNLPVIDVTWYDAVEYCNKRSQREGLTPAYTIDKTRRDPNNKNEDDHIRWLVTWNRNANGYRLPTEAEWEYACRAGTATPFSTGITITTDQANYNGNYPFNSNVKGEYRQKMTPVGSFEPNAWGLYDMHGNVCEWCWDWYWQESYTLGAQTDPRGASSGTSRVVRGGSWYDWAYYLRSALRSIGYPSSRFHSMGFRIVRPINEGGKIEK